MYHISYTFVLASYKRVHLKVLRLEGGFSSDAKKKEGEKQAGISGSHGQIG